MHRLICSQNKELRKPKESFSAAYSTPPGPPLLEAEREVCDSQSQKARGTLGPRAQHLLADHEQAPSC